MKLFRKTIKYTLRFFELFFAFLFVYLIITLVGAGISTGELKNKGDLYIYVQSNGVHTDICLPTKTAQFDWSEFVPTKDYPKISNFDFITIGWGNKGFFLDTPTWAELKFSTAFKAAFMATPTAMHVKYSKEPEENTDRKKVFISIRDYYKLIRYVKRSFVKVGGNIDLIENKGYTVSDNFYEANNTYHMFRTCNCWTNDALKIAGVKTGIYALFQGGIMDHLEGE